MSNDGVTEQPSSRSSPPRLIRDILLGLNGEVLGKLNGARLISHPGEAGRARENVIADALRSFVPDAFGIDTGFVVDALGGQSRQQGIGSCV